MNWIFAALAVAGLLPLCLAWWAKRRTSLAHALVWGIAAWLSWAAAMSVEPDDGAALHLARYLALSLTGCAGIAVLGARRPHVGAWNFVVLVLLLVMLLPLAESQFLGTSQTEGLRLLFMLGTIAVGALNYAPTRLGPAALLVLGACSGQLLFSMDLKTVRLLDGLLLTAPWLGWLGWRLRNRKHTPFDWMWLDFRDSWGFVWSQRVREQFNAGAHNASWNGSLDWGGLTKPTEEDEEKYLMTLRAVLKRFVADDQNL